MPLKPPSPEPITSVEVQYYTYSTDPALFNTSDGKEPWFEADKSPSESLEQAIQVAQALQGRGQSCKITKVTTTVVEELVWE